MSIIARNKSGQGPGSAACKAITDTRRAKQVCLGYASGNLTLASGTVAVTGAGIPSNATVVLTRTALSGTAGAAQTVTGIGTTGGFTATSVALAGGATVATDDGTFLWEARWPLFHADQTPSSIAADPSHPLASAMTSTAPTAVDLPSTLVLANQLLSMMLVHASDSVSHVTADTAVFLVALDALVVAVDQTSVNTLLNGLKAAFNAHLTQSGIHVNNDTLNTNSTAAATNLATSEALANALQTDLNAHMASAPLGSSVTIISP